MSVATAAGFRDIAATTMRYVPAIYTGKLLKKFYDYSVVPQISNGDYTGEITKFGDTVYIRTTPNMNIFTYYKGMTLPIQQPESAPVTLLIDQGKGWAYVSEDVDDAQTDLKNYTENWTTDAAEQMKISIDTAVLAAVYSDANASNQGIAAGYRSGAYNLGVSGTPREITKANVLERIVDCGSVLDELNVPETGRWFVMPSQMANLISKSDLKDCSLTGDGTSVIRNGRLGMIARFTLYQSNLLTTVSSGGHTATEMIFGHNAGLTFASQLTKNRAIDNPFGFGILYQGLQVYGYKVVKSECVGWLHGYFTMPA